MGKGLVGLREQKGADRDLCNRVKYEKVVANQVDNPAHVEERSGAHDENMHSFASLSTINTACIQYFQKETMAEKMTLRSGAQKCGVSRSGHTCFGLRHPPRDLAPHPSIGAGAQDPL